MKRIFVFISCALLLINNISYASDLSEWSAESFENLSKSGILNVELVSNDLKGAISRREVCVMLVNLYEKITGEKIIYNDNPFADTDDEFVLRAYSKRIVSGKSDDIFDPNGLITREEFAKMAMNFLNALEQNPQISKREISDALNQFDDKDEISKWAEESMAVCVQKGILTGTAYNTLQPKENTAREQAICILNRLYACKNNDCDIPEFMGYEEDEFGRYMIFWSGAAERYTVIIKDSNAEIIDMFEVNEKSAQMYGEYDPGNYTVIIAEHKNNGTEVFSLPADFVVADSGYCETESRLNLTQEEKERRVFPQGQAFASADEAEEYMTVVTVPIWKIGADGNKYASSSKLTVNSALADDVVCIFTEIFNSGEQFPIKDVGGYYWRNTASGRLSQHSYGTCIDINANENYYVQPNGAPIVGEFWKPYENPYSMPEDGIVVKTFAKYGWKWGGNCWSEKYAKDYMHFTYLGK